MVAQLRQVAEILAMSYLVILIHGMPAPVDLPVVYPGEMEANRARTRSHREDVMFPTDLLRLDPPTNRFGMPDCVTSSSSTFCENVTNYPAERIRRLLKFSPNEFDNLFGTKGINSRRTIVREELSDEPICRIRSRTVLPRLAKNDQNKWRYVINDVDYVQSVSSDQCVKEGSDCDYVHDSLPSGYRSFCKQRFSFKRLVAIDPEQENPISDSFSFPSCCSCYVKVPSIHDMINGKKRNMSPATMSRGYQK